MCFFLHALFPENLSIDCIFFYKLVDFFSKTLYDRDSFQAVVCASGKRRCLGKVGMDLSRNGGGAISTDGELCRRVQAGDPQAFWELAERYLPLVRSRAARFAGDVLDAEDLEQEGLLGLLSAARRFRVGGKASFGTYADVCVRNRMITSLRQAVRQTGGGGQPVSLNAGEAAESFHAPAGGNPEELAVRTEAYEALVRRIASALSRREKQVLLLYLRGLSYAQIAKSLGLTEKAVDNALQRARAKLKAELQE